MISSLFIGLHILLLCFLSIRVIQLRWKHKTSLGDGGVEALQRAMRAHGNLAENLPAFAFIIFLLEFQNIAQGFVFNYGLLFFIARCLHAAGIYRKSSNLRIAGMVGTLVLLIAGASTLILHFFNLWHLKSITA